EIVDRGYVRAKPSQEQLARQFDEQQRLESANARGEKQSFSQQNAEEGGEFGRTNQYPNRPSQNQLPNTPSYGPNTPSQENPQPSAPQLNNDQRRALVQASMGQGGSSPDSGGLPFDAVTGADQPQLSPEQMQQLAATYGVQLSPKSGGQSDLSKMMTTMGNNNSNFPAQTPQSQEEAYYQSHPLPEQAKLETNYPNLTQSQ